jgi:hypothetical protein
MRAEGNADSNSIDSNSEDSGGLGPTLERVLTVPPTDAGASGAGDRSTVDSTAGGAAAVDTSFREQDVGVEENSDDGKQ